ncbi:glycosyltransferase family 4 protein [Methylocapsa acidiphila]|uniref:glycosyltransferase family 4 protein n=1 Tax=Methylocapsa acidiphila TaxID=133552 RepID=UPI0004063968|nr:glycosyltransferase family 4 protein [Methylocapsa acidiphila]
MSFISAKEMFPSLTRERRRMVICALGTYSKVGGLQNFNRRVIANMAKRSIERGEFDPFVLIRGDDAASIPAIEGITIEATTSFAAFVVKGFLLGVARANIFVICHINLLPLAALVRCLRPKMPILLFVHGLEVWNNASLRPKRWYETLLARVVTRIASVSDFTADTMAREFGVPREKFRLLPNAVDPLRTTPGFGEREPATILTVNRLSLGDRDKNVDQMIRAMAMLKGSAPGLKYEIVGEGALRPELEALARELQVDDIVKFRGRVGEAELRAAYARATVFAMPSSKEGFGIVFLEAWQWGLPVICSAQGASKEVVSDEIDGFVVDQTNVAMIADRLSLLLSQPELAKAMGERGRRKVEEKYLDAAFRSNLDRIIDELQDGAGV